MRFSGASRSQRIFLKNIIQQSKWENDKVESYFVYQFIGEHDLLRCFVIRISIARPRNNVSHPTGVDTSVPSLHPVATICNSGWDMEWLISKEWNQFYLSLPSNPNRLMNRQKWHFISIPYHVSFFIKVQRGLFSFTAFSVRMINNDNVI